MKAVCTCEKDRAQGDEKRYAPGKRQKKVKEEKLIIPSVFPPGATSFFPRCDPSRSGRLKVFRAGSTPIREIPGTTTRVIPALVV